jgi:type II secretory pathway predicted ATPase ExeA
MDFAKVKELFRDRVDTTLYVPLFQKTEIDLAYAIKEKEKIILIYGESGNGKSFLMKKVYENLKGKIDSELFFIANPFDESVIDILEKKTTTHRVIFVDEAQTLNNETIERLRMASDNDNYTIVLATHEKEAKNIFSKKHFKTRINYLINLKPLKLDRIELFITSKLLQNELYDVNSLFRKSNYKLIYKITKGNLREINRLIYKTFDIIEYFSKKYPHKVSKYKIDNKYIEMAKMDLGEVDA